MGNTRDVNQRERVIKELSVVSKGSGENMVLFHGFFVLLYKN